MRSGILKSSKMPRFRHSWIGFRQKSVSKHAAKPLGQLCCMVTRTRCSRCSRLIPAQKRTSACARYTQGNEDSGKQSHQSLRGTRRSIRVLTHLDIPQRKPHALSLTPRS